MPHRLGLGINLAPPRRPERTLAVALIAVIAFNQPLLRIFDRGAGATVAGMPVIYLYLFAAWGLVIALLAAAVETRSKAPPIDGRPLPPEPLAAKPSAATAPDDPTER